MTLNRNAWPALVIFALVGPGCQDSATETGASPGADSTPPTASATQGADPKATDAELPKEPFAKVDAAKDVAVTPTSIGAVPPKSQEVVAAEVKAATEGEAKPEAAKATAPEGEVKLETVKFDEFLSRISKNKAKFTLVDAWATWCPPCRANFPHLVDMNTKYGSKGLAAVSLSFDDPTNTKAVEEAKQFLKDKKAVFANYLLDEGEGVGFDKLEINTIPAVFLYGEGGKLLRKFTLDDPNNQFTYEEVEKAVVAVLDGKPLPNP